MNCTGWGYQQSHLWVNSSRMCSAVLLSIQISLTKIEALSKQVNALNSSCWPLTLTFHGPTKSMVTSSHGAIHTSCLSRRPWLRPSNLYFWQSLYFSSSIWYPSLGWWWCWFNISRNFFFTRMSHYLMEQLDSMNYHWFRQCKLFQLGWARSFL